MTCSPEEPDRDEWTSICQLLYNPLGNTFYFLYGNMFNLVFGFTYALEMNFA